MNAQNTPIHIRLWHREFWQMALANLLLSMSVYILYPLLPQCLEDNGHFTAVETGESMAVFALGLFLFGPFCSFLVQHYRRNKVCLWSIVIMAACLGVLWYLFDGGWPSATFPLVMLLRLVQGATFGLAQMILSSTLVIDTCESYLRTEANHSMSWFGRFALSLGPLAGLFATRHFHMPVPDVLWMAVGCALFAFLLIRMVKFPFRAPSDHVTLFSTDRFWLGSGFILFVNLLLISVAVGMVLALATTIDFYAGIMVGYLFALLACRFVFRDAELKSEVVSGLILFLAALLLLMVRPTASSDFIAATLIGIAIGLIGSRFLLFFIKLSRHCQRGTSQSTYMLAWESGIALGVGITYALPASRNTTALTTSLILVSLAMLIYNLYTHRWFEHHKNR